MDQNSLVTAGSSLITALENSGEKIRGAMWVVIPESNSHRLWLVGAQNSDKRDFYRKVAAIIPTLQQHHPELSISDIEWKKDTDPAIRALSRMFRVDGLGSVYLERNMSDGVYTPDGIMLRMSL